MGNAILNSSPVYIIWTYDTFHEIVRLFCGVLSRLWDGEIENLAIRSQTRSYPMLTTILCKWVSYRRLPFMAIFRVESGWGVFDVFSLIINSHRRSRAMTYNEVIEIPLSTLASVQRFLDSYWEQKQHEAICSSRVQSGLSAKCQTTWTSVLCNKSKSISRRNE